MSVSLAGAASDYHLDAQRLVFNQASISVDSSTLTLEAGEPGAGLRSAGWVWDAIEARSATFDARRTSQTGGPEPANWVMEIYSGTPLGALVLLASVSSTGQGYVTLAVTAGTTYWVRMAQGDPDQVFAYNVWVHEPPPSVPDVTVPGDPVLASGRAGANAARPAFL